MRNRFNFDGLVPFWYRRCQFGIAGQGGAFQMETKARARHRCIGPLKNTILHRAHRLQVIEKQGIELMAQGALVLLQQEA